MMKTKKILSVKVFFVSFKYGAVSDELVTSWFISMFEDSKLLLRSLAPAALNTGGHFHTVMSY